jgi:hypothetical protein
MGYSSRYHAASLAAVFLALAVGILIGVGFGSDIVSGTADDLERSLGEDLDEARAQVDALEADLDAERAFERAVYPAVVENVLGRHRIRQVGLIGLGDVSAEVTADIEAAVGPSGAEIGQVGVVGEPPDLGRLARLADGRTARAIQRGAPDALRQVGVDAARVLVRGGPRFDGLRGTLLGRYSGQAVGTDAIVLVRDRPAELDPEPAAATDAIEDGLLAGFRSLGIPIVGVERSDADPSSIAFYADRGLSTVDSVDQVAGRVATVFALCGVSGQFGTGEGADALLPDLVGDPCPDEAGGRARGG